MRGREGKGLGAALAACRELLISTGSLLSHGEAVQTATGTHSEGCAHSAGEGRYLRAAGTHCQCGSGSAATGDGDARTDKERERDVRDDGDEHAAVVGRDSEGALAAASARAVDDGED